MEGEREGKVLFSTLLAGDLPEGLGLGLVYAVHGGDENKKLSTLDNTMKMGLEKREKISMVLVQCSLEEDFFFYYLFIIISTNIDC